MIDYRDTKNRREVFLNFYEYHLKNKAHAGAVYYVFPYIFDLLQMNTEQKLWFTFINGCSQNVVTTYLIYKEFPNLSNINISELSKYYRNNYDKFGWDTDRRYVKNKFEDCVKNYLYNLKGSSQEAFFSNLCNSDDKYKNFNNVWNYVISKFSYYGRLASFSYIEYLKIAGLNLDCGSLFLYDIKGSKSHRNGLCKVLGRDDLDWTSDNNVLYTTETLEWLEKEAKNLLEEAKNKINHSDISYFTLETTLCCYKGWHRVDRRYPNVYNDIFYDRIKKAEANWEDIDFSIFWDARNKYLDKNLRLEDNILDKGLCKEKQNHYRLTGEVIMMEKEGYEVKEKSWIRNCILIVGKCGVGKTWVMQKLLKLKSNKPYKLGKFCFHETDDLIIIGKYDGTVFEGSDKLSMSVITDLDIMLKYIKKQNKIAVFEGDRFSNSKFINKADPCIIKILGNGYKGRVERKTKQSHRQIKSISTRVDSIKSHKNCYDSTECLDVILKLIAEK
jgi:hypothetical protein